MVFTPEQAQGLIIKMPEPLAETLGVKLCCGRDPVLDPARVLV